tara:strand:- start:170 stop:865 length:696 start_codon:yes stop_codon:yes gene_type:complete
MDDPSRRADSLLQSRLELRASVCERPRAIRVQEHEIGRAPTAVEAPEPREDAKHTSVPLYKMVAIPLHERMMIEGLMKEKRGLRARHGFALDFRPSMLSRYIVAQHGTFDAVCFGFGCVVEMHYRDFSFSRLLFEEGLNYSLHTMLYDEDDPEIERMKESLARVENKISMRARRYWFIIRNIWKVAPYVKHWVHTANRPGGQGFLSGIHAIMELPSPSHGASASTDRQKAK